MKKHYFIASILSVFMAVGIFTSCQQPTSSESGSSSGGKSTAGDCMQITYLQPAAGNVYVHGDSEYAEYLSFTSSTVGTYYYYKNGVKDDSETKSFTYDPKTGTFSDTNEDIGGYLFQNAAGIVYSAINYFQRVSGSGLFTTWKSSDGSLTVKFNADGTLVVTNPSQKIDGTFSNNSGILSIELSYVSSDGTRKNSKDTFFYTSDNRIYFPYVFQCYKVSNVGARP